MANVHVTVGRETARRQVEQRLHAIEESAFDTLRQLGYPADKDACLALLRSRPSQPRQTNGRKRASHPKVKQASDVDERRASYAEVSIETVWLLRSALARDSSPEAALWALQLGVFGGTVLHEAVEGRALHQKVRAQRSRGQAAQAAKRAGWVRLAQEAADRIKNRKLSKSAAAIEIQFRLSELNVKPLPALGTIRNKITFP